MIKNFKMKFPEKFLGAFLNLISARKGAIIDSTILLVTLIILAFLIVPPGRMKIRNYKAGDIALETIRVRENMNIVDEEKTEASIKEAEGAVVSVYDYDESMIRNAAQRVSKAFENARKSYRETVLPLETPGHKKSEVTQRWLSIYKPFTEISGVILSEEDFLFLSRTRFSKNTESKVLSLLDLLGNKLIVNDKAALKTDSEKGIFLRKIGTVRQSEAYLKNLANVMDLTEAANLIREKGVPVLQYYKEYLRKPLSDLAEQMIRPNISINMQITAEKFREAKESVKPVTISIQKNEVIVREGDRINPKHLAILDGIRKAGKEINIFEVNTGIILTLLLTVFLTFAFAKAYIRKFSPTRRDLVFLAIVSVFTVLLAKLFLFISMEMGAKFDILSTPAYRFVIPIAASAMLVRFAINSETAIIFAFLVSLLLGFLFEGDINFAAYCFIGSVFGAYKVAYSETKFDLMKAGLWTGVINALAALSLEMIGGRVFSSGFVEISTILLMALASGAIIALILPTLSTLVEAAGYVTDIKLVELANFNNPLLNKLALIAPGTYHHSRVVAQLVEVAAESIHANPLLAMVIAFYHDIGKIKQPEYFVENQGTGDNKHEDLKPSMSKMIILAHVKDGVELAKGMKVPLEITDAIEQHHGTSLMTYFYQKAKEQENPEVESVDENDYRYPGPKPQTREIGLLMLADQVEAASKSLIDPTPAQLQGVIQKTFNKTFTDGQLEECEITLKDLHNIAAAFFRVLVSIYKARIDYPEVSKESKKRTNGDINPKAKEDKAKPKESKKNDSEGLKRIGIDK